MPMWDRVLAFAPLTVLTVAAAGGAVLGLGASNEPRITATDWPNVVREVIDAPGARFSYTGRSRSALNPVVEETGVVRFGPTAYDSEHVVESPDGPVTFPYRTAADDREYVKVDSCWTQAPEPFSKVPHAVAVLASADPGSDVPAVTVLTLLGAPRILWEQFGFSGALVDDLLTRTLPVSWEVDDGALVIRIDGRVVARVIAADHPEDVLAVSKVADQEATWRITPLADAPRLRGPGPVCVD